MKYCNTCGNLNYDRVRRCSVCNTRFRKLKHINNGNEENLPAIEEYSKKNVFSSPIPNYLTYTKKMTNPKKKNLLFIFPLMLIPGIGFMYASRWKKGLFFLLAFAITTTVDVITKVNGLYGFIGVTTPAYLTLIIWSIVGSLKEIKSHNEEVDNYYQKQPKIIDADFSLNPKK